MTSVVEEFIEHYGMKGMRWGVRKKPRGLSTSEFRKAQELRKRPVSQLTNKQLKTANERANLEQNYARLNPSNVAKGRAAAQGILATAGMAASAYALFQSPAGKALREIGKKKVNQQLSLF